MTKSVNMNILVIDKDEDVLFCYQEALKKQTHSFECSTGYQGVSQESIEKADVVFLDCDLPENYRVYEVQKMCESSGKTLILVTGHHTAGYKNELIKPFSSADLFDWLEKLPESEAPK